MLKLKRLKIDKFRSVAAGTVLEFHDGINVLLGQNGSGKTTLLKLISMIVRGDLSEIAGEEFSIEFDLAFEEGSCHARVVNSAVMMPQTITQPPLLAQTIRAGNAYESNAIIETQSLLDGETRLLETKGRSSTMSKGTDQDPKPISGQLSPTSPGYFYVAFWHLFERPEVLNENAYRFDESLDLFRRIHSPDLGVIEILKASRLDDTFATGFVPEFVTVLIQGRSVGSSDARLSFKSDEVPELKKFVDETGFKEVELRSEWIGEGERTDAYETFKFSAFVLLSTLRDGKSFIQDHLSYGQQRLWTFLYYLACNPSTVIADELVNGLHHRWIELCIREIGQRQAFLTSQNPLLFDCIPIGSLAEIRSRFILCRTEVGNDRHSMAWNNMSEEQAVQLHDAYDAGIEFVGEILKSRSLW